MGQYTIDRLRAFGDAPVRVETVHGHFEGSFAPAAMTDGAVIVLLYERAGDATASVVISLDDIVSVAAA
jgi:hypothetical protein